MKDNNYIDVETAVNNLIEVIAGGTVYKYDGKSGATLAEIDLAEMTDAGYILNDYSRILVTWPAPTVRPPSRIAKRRPSLSATG